MTHRREHDLNKAPAASDRSGQEQITTDTRTIEGYDQTDVLETQYTSTSATLPLVWPAANAAYLFTPADLQTNPPVAGFQTSIHQPVEDRAHLNMVHGRVSGDIIRPKAVLHEERAPFICLRALDDEPAKCIQERVLDCPPDYTWVPLLPGAQRSLAELSGRPIEDIAFSIRGCKSVTTFTTYPIQCPFLGCRFLFHPTPNEENFQSHFECHRAMGHVLSQCDCGEYPTDLARHFVERHFDWSVKCPFCWEEMSLGACEAHFWGECWGLVDLV